MKKNILFIVLFSFALVSCNESVKVDEDKLKNIKKVAVVVFTLKARIAHRDDPKDDDTDIAAWGPNRTAFGLGQKAADLAYPTFIEELNRQGLPFNVMSFEEMKSNTAFMAMQPAKKDEMTDKAMLATVTALKPNRGAASANGFINFGLPKKWKSSGSAVTGGKDELEYIRKAIEALGVDAAIVIVDRGTSFQCRLACVVGTGDSTMGGAFNGALVGKDGSVIFEVNNWFQGKAHAAMAGYIVNPAQRTKLYEQHGVRMGQVFSETLLKFINKDKA